MLVGGVEHRGEVLLGSGHDLNWIDVRRDA